MYNVGEFAILISELLWSTGASQHGGSGALRENTVTQLDAESWMIWIQLYDTIFRYVYVDAYSTCTQYNDV